MGGVVGPKGQGIDDIVARTNFYKKALFDNEIRISFCNYKNRYGL